MQFLIKIPYSRVFPAVNFAIGGSSETLDLDLR